MMETWRNIWRNLKRIFIIGGIIFGIFYICMIVMLIWVLFQGGIEEFALSFNLPDWWMKPVKVFYSNPGYLLAGIGTKIIFAGIVFGRDLIFRFSRKTTF